MKDRFWSAQSDGSDRLCPSRIFPPIMCLRQAIKAFLKIYFPLDKVCALSREE